MSNKQKGLYETLKEDLKRAEFDLEKDFTVASKVMQYEHKHNQGLKTWRFASILLLVILLLSVSLFLYMLSVSSKFEIFGRIWEVTNNTTIASDNSNNNNVNNNNVAKDTATDNNINNETVNNTNNNNTNNDVKNNIPTNTGSANDSNVKINLTIITDKNCGGSGCTADEEMVADGLKNFIGANLSTQILDKNDATAKSILKENGIKKLPFFMFSKSIDQVSKWSQLSQAMELKGNGYILNIDMAGIPAKSFIDKVEVPAGSTLIGSPNAPVTMMEFSDLQCPYCGKFHKDTFSLIKEKYIDTGKLNVYFIHVPLSFHAQAPAASNAAECANEQGKFGEFLDLSYKNETGDGKHIQEENFMEYATELKLDTTKFKACLDANTYKTKIDSNAKFAESLGVMGTPGFIIGGSDFIGGAYPFDEFEKRLQKYLK